MGPNLSQTISIYETDLLSFGFEMKKDDSTGRVTFDIVECLIFEVMTLVVAFFLLQYYNSRIPEKGIVPPIGYIYNSQWYGYYMYLYYMFFFLIACDTFFVQNFI
jgi:hypothetical protein